MCKKTVCFNLEDKSRKRKTLQKEICCYLILQIGSKDRKGEMVLC